MLFLFLFLSLSLPLNPSLSSILNLHPPYQEGSAQADAAEAKSIEIPSRTSAIIKKSSSQRATIQHLFEHFDEDSDGSLCLREFLQGFSYWKNTLTSTEDKLILFYNLFDKDKNGVMDREEFKQM